MINTPACVPTPAPAPSPAFAPACVPASANLSPRWFNEDTSLAIPKETILLSNIFSVTKIMEKQLGPSQQELFCFDLAVLNSKGKFCVYQLGALTEHDRWSESPVVVTCTVSHVQGHLAGETGSESEPPAGHTQYGDQL